MKYSYKYEITAKTTLLLLTNFLDVSNSGE